MLTLKTLHLSLLTFPPPHGISDTPLEIHAEECTGYLFHVAFVGK